MNEWINSESLFSFGGNVLICTFMTQIVKYYFTKVDPKWITLFTAILCVFTTQVIHVNNYTFENIVTSMFNVCFLVASAIGGFETIIKPIQKNIQDK